MAYETGTATSHDDFFTKMATFIEANGWTRDEFDAVTNDSGNGDETGTITDERRWNLVGDFTSTVNYWFMTDTSPSIYLYVVVEYSPGEVRHFQAGLLEKKGTYTGGEFVCAHYWHQVGGAQDSPSNVNHSFSFDGAYSETGSDRAGTIHLEGLTRQAIPRTLRSR